MVSADPSGGAHTSFTSRAESERHRTRTRSHKEINSMRLPSFVSVILVFLLALIAGGIGYAMGANNAVVTTATAAGDTGTVIVAHPGWYGGFWGFPFIGLFFAVLFFAVIFGLIRRAAWGGRGG